MYINILKKIQIVVECEVFFYEMDDVQQQEFCEIGEYFVKLLWEEEDIGGGSLKEGEEDEGEMCFVGKLLVMVKFWICYF